MLSTIWNLRNTAWQEQQLTPEPSVATAIFWLTSATRTLQVTGNCRLMVMFAGGLFSKPSTEQRYFLRRTNYDNGCRPTLPWRHNLVLQEDRLRMHEMASHVIVTNQLAGAPGWKGIILALSWRCCNPSEQGRSPSVWSRSVVVTSQCQTESIGRGSGQKWNWAVLAKVFLVANVLARCSYMNKDQHLSHTAPPVGYQLIRHVNL